MRKYGIENVPRFFLPSPSRWGFLLFYFFSFLNVPWQIKTTRCILLAPQIMYVYRETERDKILLTIMVEFMVSILLAGSAEGKSRAGAGVAKSDYSRPATTEGSGEVLRSGRFLCPPPPLRPPLPRRPEPNRALQQKRSRSLRALRCSRVGAAAVPRGRLCAPRQRGSVGWERLPLRGRVWMAQICTESEISRSALVVLAEVVVRKIQSRAAQ